MAQKETYPVVVRTEIDRRAARLGDRLVIGRLAGSRERAVLVRIPHHASQDNTLIAECRQMPLIEMPTGKLLRLPEHWKTADTANPANITNANPEPERFPVENCAMTASARTLSIEETLLSRPRCRRRPRGMLCW